MFRQKQTTFLLTSLWGRPVSLALDPRCADWKAHLRMLFWRGAIAASRATARLDKPASAIHHSTTPTWDRAGKLMGQVARSQWDLPKDQENMGK